MTEAGLPASYPGGWGADVPSARLQSVNFNRGERENSEIIKCYSALL